MHRIVIIGGGVAGLDLATALGGRAGYDVSLIDAAAQHVWKPMLHSIAAGTEDAAIAGTSYVRQARRHGFAYVPGRAAAVDRVGREIVVDAFALNGMTVHPARRIVFDTLILATGSVADPFGVPGVEEHALHIDGLAEAVRFQEHVLPRLVAAAQAKRPLSIGIVGGGATGVQLAAELVRIADTYDALGLGPARAALAVTLIDRGDRLLPAFPERVSAAARARLVELGVVVRLEADVAGIAADGVELDHGELVATDLTVWAAGVRAAPLGASIAGVDHDRSGRIRVDACCRAAPDVFAIGDTAAFERGGPETLPPTAQVAYQQAVYLSRHLPALIEGRGAPPFRYRDFGSLVALGGYDAYGALGRFGVFGRGFLRGRVAQLGHAFLYRRHQWRLHGLRRMLLLWVEETSRRWARGPEKLPSP